MLPTTALSHLKWIRRRSMHCVPQATEFNFSTPHKSATISNSHWVELKKRKIRERGCGNVKRAFSKLYFRLFVWMEVVVVLLFVHSLFCVAILLIETISRERAGELACIKPFLLMMMFECNFFFIASTRHSNFQRHYHRVICFLYLFLVSFLPLSLCDPLQFSLYKYA